MNIIRGSLLLAIIISTIFESTMQTSLPTDTHYTAGVVEFSPYREGNTLLENLENTVRDYLKIIGSAKVLPESPDILIFPESTLNNNELATFVPEPEAGIIPCLANESIEYSYNFLSLISCAARNTSTYVVINLSEKELCLNATQDPRPCAANGLNIFNTNVVFDREGRVISRYRKIHLYGESKNTTYLPEFGIFETDFGVRFGHFVCFDLLFYAPAQEMAHKMGIKDFILTSMWFGQLPFLTGVQIQSSWAYANNVNLLAAGASNPATGSTGTGIYNGNKQHPVTVMNKRQGVRKLYVAKVPKYVDKSNTRVRRKASKERQAPQPRLSQNDIFLKRDFLDHYATVLLNFTQGNHLQHRLCYRERFCCSFELSFRYFKNVPSNPNSPYYRYRLGAFDGWRGETVNETNRLKNCAIFSCIGDDINDCGLLFPGDTLMQPQVAFDRVLIESSFPKAPKYLLMPNSLRENLLPLPLDSFQWNVTERSSVQQVRFLLNTTVDDLLTFSIYGNYYDSLIEGNGDDAASSVSISAFLIALFASLALLLNNCYLF